MNDLMRDIAFAWRGALKRPATALLIVLTLALGIGVNSATFSVVRQTLLTPLPYEDPDRLYLIEQRSQGGDAGLRWSWPTIEDLNAQSRLLEDVAHYLNLPLPVVGWREPYQAAAGVVSANFFDLLGIEPLLGRGFLPADDAAGAQPVMLLAEDFWINRFNADPGVVGSSLTVKDIVFTVIGVLPGVPSYPHRNDIWIPAASDPYLLFSLTETNVNRTSGWASHALGRLAEGASAEAARRELATIAARLEGAWPEVYPRDFSLTLRPLDLVLIGDSATTFMLLFALALLVLLIACANVANLYLARVAARAQELSIREAVGADPRRIARQLLTESLLHSLTGGMLGLAIAYPCLALLKSFAEGYTPLASGIGMNGAMLLFSLAAALLTALLSGSAAALVRRDINRALKEGGGKATASATGARRRKALLIVQYALSFVVVSVGLLILLSLSRLQDQETGYDMDRILATSLMLDYDFAAQRPAVEAHMRSFARSLLDKAAAVPGVESAAIMAGTPLLQALSYLAPGPIEIEGHSIEGPGARPFATFHAVSSGYFRLLGVPLLAGDDFAPDVHAGSAPVAIVNENLARRYFPAGDAVGKRVRFSGTPWTTIIGVVENLRAERLDLVEDLTIYYNFWQYPTEALNLYVKSRGDGIGLENALRASIREIDAEQSVASMGPLNELKSAWLSPLRLRASLIALFGVLAIVVTLSGVVGLASYDVSRRIREIGVRMAVGAHPAKVMRLIVGEGLKTFLPALLGGLALMAVAAPFLQPLLYETNILDVRIHLASMALLTFAALAAMYVPARRAGLLNPAVALRAE